MSRGVLPLTNSKVNVSFSLNIAIFRFGVCGIKTWFYFPKKFKDRKNILLLTAKI